MPSKRLSPSLLALSSLLGLSLSGCMAVPLAQIAISQGPSADRACSGCAAAMAAGPIGDIGKGVGDSFRKLPGGATSDIPHTELPR